MKEKPLIDAVSKLGALPGFLFANMFLAGFFVVFVCAFCGATATVFWSSLHAFQDALELFEVARAGVFGALAVAAIIFSGLAVSVFFQKDKTEGRLLYCLGGTVGIVLFIGVDYLVVDVIREWVIPFGSLLR